MLKYLRIGVTALCLAACVLLMVLWMRSYGRREYVAARLSNTVAISVASMQGRIIFVGDVQPVDRRPGLVALTAESEHLTEWNLRWLGEPIQRAKWGVGFQRLSLGVAGTSVQMPHWLLLLLFGIIAGATWAKRPYRFSLRALLIATMLVAVGLGLVVASS
jgi:hypothetical protein